MRQDFNAKTKSIDTRDVEYSAGILLSVLHILHFTDNDYDDNDDDYHDQI